MPQLLCKIPKGLLTLGKKKAMLLEIIKVTHESVGSDPSIINVVILEVEAADYAINGEVI
jgi:4-oxalocrotonate tautomerase/trans-3-chloroacrylic acid dehalogenase beta subunit